MIFLSARGTNFTWNLEKSVCGVFLTSNDLWSRHEAGLEACILEVQSILVGAAHPTPSCSLLLALQDQEKLKIHAHQ